MADQPDNIVPLTPKALSAMEEFLQEHKRELLTILFTDLVDSTQLQSELGNAEAARLVQIHRRIVREELERHSSREVEWAGDSCLAVFEMPSDGVRFALTMQAAMRKARNAEPKLPHVRVGLHLGEIFVHRHQRGEQKTEELFGLQVSEASRVMSLARGNQIYMSRPVYDNARSAMKGQTIEGVGEVQWLNHGPYILKGSDEQVDVCEVGEVGQAPLTPPQANDKCHPASAARDVEVITPEVMTPGRGGGRGTLSLTRLLAVVLASSLIAAGAMWFATRPGPPPPPPLKRSVVAVPESNPLAMNLPAAQLALSPDGSTLAYVTVVEGRNLLHVRRLDQFEGRTLEGTDGAIWPFFSPDGSWIAFYTQATIKKVPVNGGAVLTVCPTASTFVGGAWGADNTIVISGGLQQPLMRVPASGGKPEPLTSVADVDATKGHYWPSFLPNGKDLLFTIASVGSFDDAEIATVSLDAGEVQRLVGGGANARYAMSGHILYAHSGSMLALPFDADTLTVTGSPSPVVEGLQTDSLVGATAFAVSRDGLLVYAPSGGSGSGMRARDLVWIDREGVEEPADAPPGLYTNLALSPEGGRLALSVTGQGGVNISVYDLERGTLSRLTFQGVSSSPVWLPNGNRIVYANTQSGQYNLWWRNANGTGEAEQLSKSPNFQRPNDISPDGREVLVMVLAPDSGSDIGVLDLEDPGDPRPYLAMPYIESDPKFSPDGRWVAYLSTETGRDEIYVRPYEGSAGKWQISTDGGEEPVWSPDGRELFFRNGQGDGLMVVDIDAGDSFAASRPRLLFENAFAGGPGNQYDISPDGQRFIVIKAAAQAAAYHTLYFVDNWFTELERLVPTAN